MTISLLACWDYLDMPDNIDTQPPFDDEVEEDEGDGCGVNQSGNSHD